MTEPQDSTTQMTTCGRCGYTWDDSISTAITPVPAGRCPLEITGECIDRDAHLAHARYLGADAALAAASGLTMSEADATSILDGDGDGGVLDRYPEPALSPWEEACSQTLASMLDVLVATEAHAAAWEQGRDGCWSDAVEAFAYRLLGNIPMALAIEASNEAYVASLRTAAGL